MPQFEDALRKLSVAIHTDWEWVKFHTRLQVEALLWDANQRDASYVVHGTALAEAEQQLFRAAGRDPQPTSLQVEYVTASGEEEARSQQEKLGLERKARRRQRYVLAALRSGWWCPRPWASSPGASGTSTLTKRSLGPRLRRRRSSSGS